MKNGAGDETRTRDPQLGRLMLYQLSYTRPTDPHRNRRRASARARHRTDPKLAVGLEPTTC
jgi:hypothetical protein